MLWMIKNYELEFLFLFSYLLKAQSSFRAYGRADT